MRATFYEKRMNPVFKPLDAKLDYLSFAQISSKQSRDWSLQNKR